NSLARIRLPPVAVNTTAAGVPGPWIFLRFGKIAHRVLGTCLPRRCRCLSACGSGFIQAVIPGVPRHWVFLRPSHVTVRAPGLGRFALANEVRSRRNERQSCSGNEQFFHDVSSTSRVADSPGRSDKQHRCDEFRHKEHVRHLTALLPISNIYHSIANGNLRADKGFFCSGFTTETAPVTAMSAIRPTTIIVIASIVTLAAWK